MTDQTIVAGRKVIDAAQGTELRALKGTFVGWVEGHQTLDASGGELIRTGDDAAPIAKWKAPELEDGSTMWTSSSRRPTTRRARRRQRTPRWPRRSEVVPCGAGGRRVDPEARSLEGLLGAPSDRLSARAASGGQRARWKNWLNGVAS